MFTSKLNSEVKSMNLLLSIKPKYVEAIINGTKKFEFRKVGLRKRNLTKVFIYSTSPVKKIVGTFEVGKIIAAHPEKLWKELKDYSGLNREEFFAYFRKKNKGVAIQIKNLTIFDRPLDTETIIPDFVPRQSFQYVGELNFQAQDF